MLSRFDCCAYLLQDSKNMYLETLITHIKVHPGLLVARFFWPLNGGSLFGHCFSANCLIWVVDLYFDCTVFLEARGLTPFRTRTK